MKYLILGAGPAGLVFANSLLKRGETSFLVLEKEEEAGGLCRSKKVNETYVDIGGGHILDVRRTVVNEFIFSFMPKEEWNYFTRNSKINIEACEIDHPIESNIWQLPISAQIDYLKSIAIAGCNTNVAKPDRFTDWIYWKLGDRIANDYMIPYNQKIFSKNLDELGSYWLEKLPNVSFEETLRSCLEKKAYGTQPGHANFYYPKEHGYGELWRRMANEIKSNIEYKVDVKSINFNTMEVTSSEDQKYHAEKIITTIPWIEFENIYGMPKELVDKLNELKSNSIQVDYYAENLNTEAQWVYYPDKSLSYHRILMVYNLNNNFKGYCTETNSERISLMKESGIYQYFNKYAYPLNTREKPEIMNELLTWARNKNVIGLGRWGEHQHYNSDVVVELAMKLAEDLLNKKI